MHHYPLEVNLDWGPTTTLIATKLHFCNHSILMSGCIDKIQKGWNYATNKPFVTYIAHDYVYKSLSSFSIDSTMSLVKYHHVSFSHHSAYAPESPTCQCLGVDAPKLVWKPCIYIRGTVKETINQFPLDRFSHSVPASNKAPKSAKARLSRWLVIRMKEGWP